MAGVKQIPFRVAPELFERIELARGTMPRERWLREAILAHLTRLEAAGSPVARLFDRTEADATRIRSSRAARADVKPIPKGGSK